jgi:hypothetical protein
MTARQPISRARVRIELTPTAYRVYRRQARKRGVPLTSLLADHLGSLGGRITDWSAVIIGTLLSEQPHPPQRTRGQAPVKGGERA